jgi:hypothetical protein
MSAKVSCPVLRGGESGDARTLPDARYAAYLKGIPVESITSQEREFMKTLEEIDAFFETYPAENRVSQDDDSSKIR